jgi:hypothetical protein
VAILSPFPSYSISVKPNNLLLSADQTSPLIFISSNINIPTLHSNGLSDCSRSSKIIELHTKTNEMASRSHKILLSKLTFAKMLKKIGLNQDLLIFHPIICYSYTEDLINKRQAGVLKTCKTSR